MDGWETLGARIYAERSRRWRTRPEFSRETGLSTRVLVDIEKGRRSSYRPTTLSAVEAALGWTEGSCMRVVNGGQPGRIADPQLSRLIRLWPSLSRDTRTALVVTAESMARK